MNDMTQNSGGMSGGMGGNVQGFSLTPKTLDEAMRYAEVIAGSEVVPQDYKNKPGNVLVAMQMGMEVGLPPLQALQNIAVINGRPAIWGDAMLALVRSHPECRGVREDFDQQAMAATCTVTRKGEEPQSRTFSQQDAENAGLWGKQGPWKSYPKRMLQMRARAFAIRDVFPDALRGMAVAEEAKDIPAGQGDSTDTPSMKPAEATVSRPALPQYGDDEFAEKLEKLRSSVESGKRTADEALALVESRATLTEAQRQQILDLGAEKETA